MQKLSIAVVLLAGCFLMSAPACADQTAAPQAEGPVQATPSPDQEAREAPASWPEAGKEMREAGGAVAGATEKSVSSAWEEVKSKSAKAWEKTKEGAGEAAEVIGDKSREAWQETREGTRELWHRGKAAIHEATAPEEPPRPAPPTPANAVPAPVQPVQPDSAPAGQSADR